MKTCRIQPQEPNFGLKRTIKTLYHFSENGHCISLNGNNSTLCAKTIAETVHLKNGKKLTISKTIDKMGELQEKLYYLRDEMGNWVKSKLQYFKGGRVVKELKGEKNA